MCRRPLLWASVRFWWTGSPRSLGLCVLVLCLLPVWRAVALDAEQRALVGRLEGAINGLTTVQARIIQSNPDGSYDTGSLWIKRPGQMRLEYDAPNPLLLIATGSLFVYANRRLKEVTHLPLSDSPAAPLLASPVRLSSSAYRLTHLEEGLGQIALTLEEAQAPEKGTLTLIFSPAPLMLRQWEVVDAQGLRTRVTLEEVRTGMALEDELFRFRENWAQER